MLFLHTITINYPENPSKEEKEIYRKFFNLLGDVLPCEKCKAHYKENIKEYPINLESREEITKWLFDIHNIVNNKNNKENYDYDDFILKYTNLYDKKRKKKLYLIIFLSIILLFLLYKIFN